MFKFIVNLSFMSLTDFSLMWITAENVPKAVANTAPLLPNEKTSVDSEAGAVTQLEESSEKKLSQWRVMRVEILLEQAKDKRLLVYKTPEGDENFVDTFDDFKLCTRDSKVLRGWISPKSYISYMNEWNTADTCIFRTVHKKSSLCISYRT